jgi:hypothetical protein
LNRVALQRFERSEAMERLERFELASNLGERSS